MNSNYIETDFIIKWNLIATNNITNVKNHSCIYHKGHLILFGGYINKKDSNSVYSYSILENKFTQCTCKGIMPKPRNGHTSTVINNKMIMVGGWLGEEEVASEEVYQLTLDSFEWSKLSPQPPIGPLNMHTADLHIQSSTIYLFRGGNGSAFLNDLIAYNINSNTTELIRLSGKIPSRRANHMSSIVGDYLYIFGGWSGHALLNDLYCINVLTKTSMEIHTSSGIKPSFRAGARIVSNDSFLILFGGFEGNRSYLNDVHFFDLENQYWFSSGKIINQDKAPLSRAGHSMTIVTDDSNNYNQHIYIFGGSANSSYFNGIYLLEIDLEPEMSINTIKPEQKLSTKHMELIRNNFKSLFNNPLFSDIDILIENKIIKAHKFILSLSSTKFESMFSLNNMIEQHTLTITHYKYIHYEVFLKYFYSGALIEAEVDFDNISSIHKDSIDNVSQIGSFAYSYSIDQRRQSNTTIAINSWSLGDYLELVRICDEYCVNNLKIWCEKSIANYLSCDNYSMIVAFAKKYNCNSLIKYLDWYYIENKSKVKIEDLTIVTSSSQ